MVIDPIELQRHVGSVDDAADIVDPDRGAIAVRDDHLAERARLHELAVGADLIRLLLPLQGAERQFDGAVRDRRRDIVDAEPARRQRGWVHLDRRGIFLLPEDDDLPDPGQHRDALCQIQVGILIELVQGHHIGGQSENQDRLVSRVDLAVGRRVRQVFRQDAARLVDRRLHVGGGAVDIARQVELQRDRRGPLHIRRRDLVHPRQCRELALERLRHRGRHDLRAGARQRRADADRWEIDGRQRGHRQEAVADHAADQQRSHQQRRRDRPPDERFGYVHRGLISPAPDGAVLIPVLPTPSGPISGCFAFISPGWPCCTATCTPGANPA